MRLAGAQMLGEDVGAADPAMLHIACGIDAIFDSVVADRDFVGCPGLKIVQRPQMLEVDAVADREPLLRLRHAITNTNYYVSIYAESGPHDTALRSEIKVSPDELLWHPVPQLHALPLTGLARKVLMRLDLMSAAGPENPKRRP